MIERVILENNFMRKGKARSKRVYTGSNITDCSLSGKKYKAHVASGANNDYSSYNGSLSEYVSSTRNFFIVSNSGV